MIQPVNERRHAMVQRRQLHPDPNQPRKDFPQSKLVELADSWRAIGQQQDLIVFEHPQLPPDEFFIADGERRYRCMPFVPAEEVNVTILPEAPDPIRLLTIQLALGATGEKLNPFELADGCQRLQLADPTLTQEAIAATIGISAPKLSKAMGINEWLAPALRADVEKGLIPFSAAAALARLRENVPMQLDLAAKVKDGLLKRDAVEARVAAILAKGPRPARPLKLTFGGVVMTVKGKAVEALRTLHVKLGDVLKKLDKEGWGDEFLPSLMNRHACGKGLSPGPHPGRAPHPAAQFDELSHPPCRQHRFGQGSIHNHPAAAHRPQIDHLL
jgi:ParB/RepB/Spo0J family partition protein